MDLCGLAACKDTKVQIGSGSLMSDGVRIYSGDCHPIYRGEDRINSDEDVIIGTTNWLGDGSIILKGVCTPNNAIVGAQSVVTKSVFESGVIIAGNPARIIQREFVGSIEHETSLWIIDD